MNEYIIRNLSKTLREIAEATTKPKTNQEKKPLNSFARVMLDRTALDHTLAEQGRFYSVVTTSCTWINTW